MFLSSVYGIGIRSFLPLPELSPGRETAEVIIRRGSLKRPTSLSSTKSDCILTENGNFYFFYKAGVLFCVRNGNEIIVDASKGTNEELLRAALTGPCLAFLLYQRGYFVLHGSAVEINGKAIAFAGAKGWGKSTLASSFYARGHKLIADDVTAITFDEKNKPKVWPGFPQIKLWPSSARALGYLPKTMPKLHSLCEKRVQHLNQGSFSKPLPLGSIYILAKSNTQTIEPLQSQEAFIELIRHSYGTYVINHLKKPAHFFQCSHIVNRVPVRRLKRGRSLSKLPQLVKIVEEDIKKYVLN